MAALLVAVGTSYHVDPRQGDDHSSGTSPGHAWRTLLPLSKVHLRPGDRLLIAAGTTLAGPLRLNGTENLLVASYGNGHATIDGGAGDGIVADGGKNLRIRDLTLIASGRKANDGRGISLENILSATIERVDVSGYRLAGIEITGSKRITVSHVVAHDNGAAGIAVSGGKEGLSRSSDITIRDCKALKNPGDPKNLTNHSGNGIVVGGVDRCLIEYCEAANNGWDMPRKGNGPVGIWAWNASRVTIQRCISHENRSPGDDGGGFDFDGGVTDSVLQYNLSFGNAGTGYLLCQYGGGGRWKNNVVRHNISYEDGLRSFGSGIALYIPKGMDNMSDALIEHNTIVSSRYAVSTVGDLPGMIYRNNAFLSGGETLNLAWGEGGFKNSTFGKNLAWSATRPNPVLLGVSPFSSIEAWEETGGLSSDPSLLLPTSIADLPTDPRSLAKMGFFRPLEGSPCLVGRSQLLGARL